MAPTFTISRFLMDGQPHSFVKILIYIRPRSVHLCHLWVLV